jgi:LmbE family N-acetylglucosaminyl deacetylase
VSKLTAIAIVAHPDDIEFTMAGTMLLLKERGADIHFWNLANGCYGSMVYSRADITRIRAEEAKAAAKRAGAVIHAPIADDLNIFYSAELIARVAAVVRAVKPQIILTHPPRDYMEDHMNASRLAVTGAFIRAAPNYESVPPVSAWDGDTVVYHSVPHGLKGPLREPVEAEFYVDIGSVLARKGELLALHKSQQEWLDATQGMGSMVAEMEEFCADIGRRSRRFKHAEAFRRHLHFGYGPEAFDPLSDALGDKVWADPAYVERG